MPAENLPTTQDIESEKSGLERKKVMEAAREERFGILEAYLKSLIVKLNEKVPAPALEMASTLADKFLGSVKMGLEAKRGKLYLTGMELSPRERMIYATISITALLFWVNAGYEGVTEIIGERDDRFLP